MAERDRVGLVEVPRVLSVHFARWQVSVCLPGPTFTILAFFVFLASSPGMSLSLASSVSPQALCLKALTGKASCEPSVAVAATTSEFVQIIYLRCAQGLG